MLTSYLDQLKQLADGGNFSLKEMFLAAGLPDSTYYRAVNGTNELRYDTAKRVADVITAQLLDAAE